MNITVTVEHLKKLDACADGLAAFRELFGESGTVDWTREKQIEILRGPLGLHIGWAVEQGLVPLWSMSKANLVGASLAGASLDGANLAGANLAGSSLVGASLVGANLAGASLDGANLARANLVGASLARANLAGASLVGANLAGASLVGAKVCLCDSVACVNLRGVLAAAGWKVGTDGLLEKKEPGIA